MVVKKKKTDLNRSIKGEDTQALRFYVMKYQSKLVSIFKKTNASYLNKFSISGIWYYQINYLIKCFVYWVASFYIFIEL